MRLIYCCARVQEAKGARLMHHMQPSLIEVLSGCTGNHKNLKPPAIPTASNGMQVAAKCRENGAEHVDIIPADLADTKNADTLAHTCAPAELLRAQPSKQRTC